MPQTLEEIRAIREQVLRVHKDRKVPMVVVGNKVAKHFTIHIHV